MIVAGSIVVHVAVMAVIDAVEPPATPKIAPRPVVIDVVSWSPPPAPVPEVEPPPMEVALVPADQTDEADETDEAVRPLDPPPPPRAPAAAIDRGAPAAGTAGAIGAVPGAATGAGIPGEPGAGAEETSGGHGMLSMRRPKLPDLSKLSVNVDIDGGRPPPPPIVPSGELAPSGGGTFRAAEPGFDVRIARDGRVTFDDKPAAHIRVVVPRSGAAVRGIGRTAARGLEEWYRDPGAAIRAAGGNGGGAKSEERATKLPETVFIPMITGGVELTDLVMRANGDDPYMSAKRDFLDRTREERTELRKQDEARRLKQTVTTVRQHVARVWAQTTVSAAERRAAIFEIWDDCAEAGDVEEGDGARVEAGNEARTAVIGFVRAKLPAGSPDAYTDAELAALNARRTSKATFAPY